MSISAVVIAKDEEKMLPFCLKKLGWVDEIVVIDNGSSDATAKIAKAQGARVVAYPSGKNYSELRIKGREEAKSDWILYIDADERVTKELKKEIKEIISSNNALGAYAIPRRNFVLGHELRHGGFWPDYQKRLFRKADLRLWKGEVHEEPDYKGDLGKLKNPMIHEKHETLSEMVEKTNYWSEVEGRLMFDANHPPMNIPRFLSAMFREFWLRMVVNKAFLDGKIGVIFAFYQVFSRFVSYSKLWELQLKNHESRNI